MSYVVYALSRGRTVFVDGVEYEAFYETTAGLVWVLTNIKISDEEICFDGFIVYPVTGAHLAVGAGQMLAIFRTLMDAAREQGFSRCVLTAHRTSGAAPGRMIRIVRRLI